MDITLEPNHWGQVTLPCWWVKDFERGPYPYWGNFLDSLEQTAQGISIEAHNQKVYEGLRPYNARLRTPKTYPHYIRFDSEKDATLFLLKFS